MIFVLALVAAAYAVLMAAPAWPIRILVCAAMAIAYVLGGYIGHEAGHLSITRRPGLAALYGRVFMTALTGITYTFYTERHRQHHRHANIFVFDPDIQCEGSSVCRQSVDTKSGVGLWITANQQWLLWLWIPMIAFALKFDSFRFCLRNFRRTQVEQTVLLLHVVFWFGLPATVIGLWPAVLNYALSTSFAGPYLAAVFYTNHLGTEYLDGRTGLSFLHHQLATSRNISGGRLRNFFSGGLNHHIEHHLFPTISMWKLPVARDVTYSFCCLYGLEYREQSWRNAVTDVLGQLNSMAELGRNRRHELYGGDRLTSRNARIQPRR